MTFLLRTVLFCMLLAAGTSAFADRVVSILVVESRPGNREFVEALQVELKKLGVTAAKEVTTVEQAVDSGVKVVVAVGAASFGQISAQPRHPPVLAAMMTRQGFERAAVAGDETVSALHLDQPESRFMDLISLLPGSPATVGVLRSDSSGVSLPRLRVAAQRTKLRLIEGVVTTEREIAGVINTVAGQSDLVLATPDPLVFSPQSIQSILLSTFRARVPLIGFSPAYTRAGALVSVHSSSAQLAAQAAEMVRQTLERGKLPPPQAPREFDVTINRNVARSLGFEMPAEALLSEQIRSRERAR